jgi:hypothetical protein
MTIVVLLSELGSTGCGVVGAGAPVAATCADVGIPPVYAVICVSGGGIRLDAALDLDLR